MNIGVENKLLILFLERQAAILAGDALLNYAYETAFCAFDMAKDEKEFTVWQRR